MAVSCQTANRNYRRTRKYCMRIVAPCSLASRAKQSHYVPGSLFCRIIPNHESFPNVFAANWIAQHNSAGNCGPHKPQSGLCGVEGRNYSAVQFLRPAILRWSAIRAGSCDVLPSLIRVLSMALCVVATVFRPSFSFMCLVWQPWKAHSR